MSSRFSKICPILVVYGQRDNKDYFSKKVAELTKIFVNVIIVDNNTGHSSNAQLLGSSVHIIHNKNVGGLAGAYNKAISHIKNELSDVSKVLFLDDDTCIYALELKRYVNRLIEIQESQCYAAVSGRYWDINSQSEARYLYCETWSYSRIKKSTGVVDVTFLINSMAIWDLRCLQALGAFNEELGVDHIDSEMCIRAAEAGMRICADLGLRFEHSIGKRRSYGLLGLKFNSGNHSPDRRFLIGRATGYLLRSRGFSWPSVGFLMLQRLVYETVGILLAESNRRLKIIMLLSGIWSGIFKDYKSIRSCRNVKAK